ncbi:MAG: PIN domain-containing protein [Firmicutes bacterium]|nr:PIN domain-containing protein [Bacillota bacterium]
MKNIFIDAQIWLSLYDFSSDDLDQFGKLKDLIVHGNVKIILTEQVRDEVMRNRENKLKDVLTKTENIKFSTPVLYQGYKTEYESLRKSIVSADKTNGELRTKIRHDIEKQTLPQDCTGVVLSRKHMI